MVLSALLQYTLICLLSCSDVFNVYQPHGISKDSDDFTFAASRIRLSQLYLAIDQIVSDYTSLTFMSRSPTCPFLSEYLLI